MVVYEKQSNFYIRRSRRIPKSIKDDRDLLVYLTCTLTNEETEGLFGMSYSAVSYILSFMRTRMQKDSKPGRP